MKQKYYLLLLIVSIGLFTTNFDLQAQEIMYLKQENRRPIVGQLIDEETQKINYNIPLGTKSKDEVGALWVVFSDRNDNKTYEKPDISSRVTKDNIGFMKRFYVVDEKGEFVQIATTKSSTGKITVDSVYGWIPKKKLLLWTDCMVNKNEITKKALVLNNIDVMQNKGKIDTTKLAQFYTHPGMQKDDYATSARLFNVYYVYKVLSNAILVGKQKSFRSETYTDVMLGWSNVQKITLWDSRVCLEHNSSEAAVQERAKQNDEYIVFKTKYKAEVYKNGKMPRSEHIVMKMDDYEAERRAGSAIRFPILEADTLNGILKICSIGEIVTKDGKKVDGSERDNAKKKLRKTLKNIENINILFVIDGTKGMENVLTQISEAIRLGTENLKNGGKDIKMGAVIYRNDKAGKNRIEIKSLQKPTDISRFLNEVDTNYEFEEEGSLVFEGLKTGIENAGLTSKQTNIIMVFGRAGNPNDVLQSEITKLVADKNCHIMAMQVEDRDSRIYRDFSFQFQYIILDAATERYKKYNQEDGGVWEPYFDEVYTDENRKRFKLKNTSAIGTLIYPSAGREMPPNILLTETVDVIENIEKNVKKYAKRLNDMIEGLGTGTTGFERFDPAIKILVDDLTDGEINAVSEDNFQASKIGYVVLKPNDNAIHRMYEYALFLDNAELSKTVTILENFNKSSLTHEKQLKLIESTWKTVLRDYEGVNIADYEDLTLEQIHKKVFGLPVQTSFLKEIKLRNIKNMSIEQANAYMTVMKNSWSRLNNILRRGAKYPFSFSNNSGDNEAIYYWILERDLP